MLFFLGSEMSVIFIAKCYIANVIAKCYIVLLYFLQTFQFKTTWLFTFSSLTHTTIFVHCRPAQENKLLRSFFCFMVIFCLLFLLFSVQIQPIAGLICHVCAPNSNISLKKHEKATAKKRFHLCASCHLFLFFSFHIPPNFWPQLPFLGSK